VGGENPQVDRFQGRIYAPSVANSRLHQGEILENLLQSRITAESIRLVTAWTEESGEPKPGLVVDFAQHPLVIVLSQDCDLEQDYNARRGGGSGKLLDILFCDVYHADSLKSQLGKSLKEWKVIAENQSPRYQFLGMISTDEDAAGTGLPSLALDFKRYFTLPADEVYERLSIATTFRRCVLGTPYVEHFVQRFFSFLSRVALPIDHPTDAG